MKTATVRDLRSTFCSLEAWLAEGETICMEKRGTPVALLSPATSATEETRRIRKANAAARREAIWRSRCFSAEEVKEMRDYELEGEDG